MLAAWNDADRAALDFVKKLLTVDPDERMTAEQALAHPVREWSIASVLTPQWLANTPAAPKEDEPVSAASDASLPDLARQEATSGDVKRQPTLREVAPGQHVPTNADAMPNDTDAAHPQLSSCPSYVELDVVLALTLPSWRFMPNCSKSSAKGVRDIKIPAGTTFDDSDGSSGSFPPSLVQSLNDASDTDSPSPSQPQTRRSSYTDIHAQQNNHEAIKSKFEGLSVGSDAQETMRRSSPPA